MGGAASAPAGRQGAAHGRTRGGFGDRSASCRCRQPRQWAKTWWRGLGPQERAARRSVGGRSARAAARRAPSRDVLAPRGSRPTLKTRRDEAGSALLPPLAGSALLRCLRQRSDLFKRVPYPRQLPLIFCLLGPQPIPIPRIFLSHSDPWQDDTRKNRQNRGFDEMPRADRRPAHARSYRRSTLKSKMLATAFASAVQGLVLPSAAGVHNVRSASITRSRVDLFFLSDEGKRNPAAVLEDEGVCHLLTDSQRVRARAASRFPAPHRCGLRSTFSECCRTAPQLLCHSCSATHTRPANAWTSMDPRRMPSTR